MNKEHSAKFAAAARLYWQGLSVLHAALALPLLLAGQATAAAVAAAGCAACAAIACRFHQAARPGNVKTSSRRALIGD